MVAYSTAVLEGQNKCVHCKTFFGSLGVFYKPYVCICQNKVCIIYINISFLVPTIQDLLSLELEALCVKCL